MKLKKGDKVMVVGGPKKGSPFNDYTWPDVYNKHLNTILEVAKTSPGEHPNCYEVVTYRHNTKNQMSCKFYDFELRLIAQNGWDY